jgi:hypothetical protein
MSEQSLGFVNQLIDKTKQGKLSWSIGFEDGQFKTLLPEGKLAFVVQAKGDVHKFRMLDEYQDLIVEEIIPFSKVVADRINMGVDTTETLYLAIGELQELARSGSLHVNEKLAKAEKLLAAI